MKIVFMGTPDFAVPILHGLIKAGHQIGCVVTQPDKAKDRGKKVRFTPVKELALANGIEVLQPEKIKDSPQTLEYLRSYEPDCIVVAAYGQIIQKDILELPKFGCINVHASLLPKLRGASPIQHAILQGEEKTGVTIMQMGEGLDTGDMLNKAETLVDGKSCQALHDELAQMGADLLAATLPKLEAGAITPEKQDDGLSTYAGMIAKQDGKIDFGKTPVEIERQIRAFDPWPGAFCRYKDQVMKIWRAECTGRQSDALNGTIVEVCDEGIDICCGGSILRAVEIQLPGKKRVDIKAFLRGNKIEKNTLLG